MCSKNTEEGDSSPILGRTIVYPQTHVQALLVSCQSSKLCEGKMEIQVMFKQQENVSLKSVNYPVFSSLPQLFSLLDMMFKFAL
jgi:hypothetical protein